MNFKIFLLIFTLLIFLSKYLSIFIDIFNIYIKFKYLYRYFFLGRRYELINLSDVIVKGMTQHMVVMISN